MTNWLFWGHPLMALVHCLPPDIDWRLFGAEKHCEILLEKNPSNSSTWLNFVFSVNSWKQNLSFQESGAFWMWNQMPVKFPPSSCALQHAEGQQHWYRSEWSSLEFVGFLVHGAIQLLKSKSLIPLCVNKSSLQSSSTRVSKIDLSMYRLA